MKYSGVRSWHWFFRNVATILLFSVVTSGSVVVSASSTERLPNDQDGALSQSSFYEPTDPDLILSQVSGDLQSSLPSFSSSSPPTPIMSTPLPSHPPAPPQIGPPSSPSPIRTPTPPPDSPPRPPPSPPEDHRPLQPATSVAAPLHPPPRSECKQPRFCQHRNRVSPPPYIPKT